MERTDGCGSPSKMHAHGVVLMTTAHMLIHLFTLNPENGKDQFVLAVVGQMFRWSQFKKRVCIIYFGII